MGKQCKQWDFTILGSKITADGGWSHEIKRCWLLGGNAMTNLDRVLKSRYIANKSASSQSYVSFSSHVWMWELEHKEGWVPNNWCFWTVVLEKTLESPLDRRKIKPVNPEGRQIEYSLEGLMLKLKFQSFGHLMQRTDSLEKTLMLGKIKGRRRRGWQRMRWLGGITDSMDVSWANSGRWWKTGKPGLLQSMGSQRVRHDWATEQQIYYEEYLKLFSLWVDLEKAKQDI